MRRWPISGTYPSTSKLERIRLYYLLKAVSNRLRCGVLQRCRPNSITLNFWNYWFLTLVDSKPETMGVSHTASQDPKQRHCVKACHENNSSANTLLRTIGFD